MSRAATKRKREGVGAGLAAASENAASAIRKAAEERHPAVEGLDRPPRITLKASQRIAAASIVGKMQFVMQRQQEFDRARQALENCATLKLEIEAEKKEFFAECEAEYNLPAGSFERGEYTIQNGEIVKQ